MTKIMNDLHFQSFLEMVPDALVVIDTLGTITTANQLALDMFQYQRVDLINQPIEILVPHHLKKKHVVLRDRYINSPKVRPMGESQSLHGLASSGKTFPIEVSLSPIQTSKGSLVISMIRDVTLRKEVEENLKSTLEEKSSLLKVLEHAIKSKDQSLANISHELRTPLNAVIGFTGTLLMQLPGPLNGEQEKQLRTIQANAEHLLALINNILDIARVESGRWKLQIEQIDCQQVIQNVYESLLPLAEKKKISLKIDLPPTPLNIATDKRMLMQIVLNFVSNAIKFTNKGSITIRLHRENNPYRHSTIISVEDTGVGIKQEDKAKLFQPFSQLDTSTQRQAEGAGLGLHLSQKMAQLLGGNISLRSKYGAGTTITLTLPEEK